MMSLFSNIDHPINILPYDGTVFFYDKIIDSSKANEYYQYLFNQIEWRNDEAFIYGKHIITKRKVAWYGNENYEYKYSNTSRFALPFTSVLLELKSIVESSTKTTYNSCLLNLYHSGEEGMTWHSDDEKTMAKNGSIASLSFGATRKFSLKHITKKELISLNLESGSLLEMKDETQSHWLHAIPKTTKIKTPRINLTFRNFIS